MNKIIKRLYAGFCYGFVVSNWDKEYQKYRYDAEYVMQIVDDFFHMSTLLNI